MESIDYTSFVRDVPKLFDRVSRDHKPLLITRPDGKPVVVMSADDFSAYEETAYLMASPRNAARLNEAIAEFEAGGGQSRDLIDE